jgi:hypothetical protein
VVVLVLVLVVGFDVVVDRLGVIELCDSVQHFFSASQWRARMLSQHHVGSTL